MPNKTPSQSSPRTALFWFCLIAIACLALPCLLFYYQGQGREQYTAIFLAALAAGIFFAGLPLPSTFTRRYVFVFLLVFCFLLPISILAFIHNSLLYNRYGYYGPGLYLLGFFLGYVTLERLRSNLQLNRAQMAGLVALFLLPGLWLYGAYAFEQVVEQGNTAHRKYLMAVSCDPDAPPAVEAKQYTIFGGFTEGEFDLASGPYTPHPPLEFEKEPYGYVKDARIFTAREGTCLKVAVYQTGSGYIRDVYYVQAPDFDISGMAASPLPDNDARDVKLENGTVLQRIRHGEAMGAARLTDDSITWRRVYGNYYYINGFSYDKVHVNGIFTEKTGLDLRPYLGDGTKPLNILESNGIRGHLGDIPFTLRVNEGDGKKKIILTPVARCDLPEDFPFESVRWIPVQSPGRRK